MDKQKEIRKIEKELREVLAWKNNLEYRTGKNNNTTYWVEIANTNDLGFTSSVIESITPIVEKHSLRYTVENQHISLFKDMIV